jgi:hypothetical protein
VYDHLRYPPHPDRARVPYFLVIAHQGAGIEVAETPTIGFPAIIESILLQTPFSPSAPYRVGFFVADSAFTTGDELNGRSLLEVSGDNQSGSTKLVGMRSWGPVTFRPRALLRQAGLRLRLVVDSGIITQPFSALFDLCPLFDWET